MVVIALVLLLWTGSQPQYETLWLKDNAMFYKALIEKKQQRDNYSFA